MAVCVSVPLVALHLFAQVEDGVRTQMGVGFLETFWVYFFLLTTRKGFSECPNIGSKD